MTGALDLLLKRLADQGGKLARASPVVYDPSLMIFAPNLTTDTCALHPTQTIAKATENVACEIEICESQEVTSRSESPSRGASISLHSQAAIMSFSGRKFSVNTRTRGFSTRSESMHVPCHYMLIIHVSAAKRTARFTASFGMLTRVIGLMQG